MNHEKQMVSKSQRYLDNDTSVSNVILYDSGKIIFKDGVPVIEQLKLSDSISVLTTSKSSVTPTITQTDNSIKLTYGSSSANVGVVSTNWFAEEVGDFDLRFKITVSLPSYTYQSFNFAADNDTVVNSTDCAWNHGINIIPNGYNLRFGMGAEYSNISYGLYRVENSRATISEPGYKSPYMYNAGYEYVVRIVKKAEKIQVYLYRGHSEQSEVVMLQQWSDYSYAKGGFYWWLRDGCGGSTVTDITLYDTANYEVVESVAEVRYAAEAKALAEEIVTRVDSEVTMDAYSAESIEMVKNKANAVLSLGDEEITIETYSDLKEAYLYFIKSIDFSTNLYVFSDSHTAKLSDYLVRADKTEIDAIISSGDNTNLGSEFEYYMFINNFQRVLATEKWRDKLLIATGNHDLGECARASETNKVYQGVADIHLNSLNHSGYFIDGLGNIYYAQTINNCRIIVLGTQSPNLQWYPKYSDEQLAWLDSELDVYSGKMPTFVINHWKLEASYWKSNSGTALSAITDILSKYPNVFYISGHSHNPITSRQMIFYPSGSGKYQITNINLPSICEDGNVSFYISVSDDYLLVRPYGGEEGEFITSYDTLIKLQKSNIIGDVNGDFDINSLDLTSLRKHMLKVENADNPDVNDDSEVDIRDLVRLKKMLTSQSED